MRARGKQHTPQQHEHRAWGHGLRWTLHSTAQRRDVAVFQTKTKRCDARTLPGSATSATKSPKVDSPDASTACTAAGCEGSPAAAATAAAAAAATTPAAAAAAHRIATVTARDDMRRVVKFRLDTNQTQVAAASTDPTACRRRGLTVPWRCGGTKWPGNRRCLTASWPAMPKVRPTAAPSLCRTGGACRCPTCRMLSALLAVVSPPLHFTCLVPTAHTWPCVHTDAPCTHSAVCVCASIPLSVSLRCCAPRPRF